MDKKGLNEIITTVLIILLILIAIAILWFFLRPFITKNSESIEQTGTCLTLNIEPIKCEYTVGDGKQKHIFVTLQRDGGEGVISAFDMIFTTADGQYKTFNNTQVLFNATLPKQYEIQYPIIRVQTQQDNFTPKKVKIALQLTGYKDICPSYSKEIDCKEYTYTRRSTDIYGSNCARGADGFVNGHDFDCFSIDYESRDIYADFNQDLTVDTFDFRDFNAAFEAGF